MPETMTGSFFMVARHNLAVETFLSDGGGTRLQSGVKPPYPQVFHKIKVYWQRGYPTEIQVKGFLASGSPLSYVGQSPDDEWVNKAYNVTTDAEIGCQMNISTTPQTARIQCVRVAYSTPWWNILQPYKSVLGKNHVEYQFNVT